MDLLEAGKSGELRSGTNYCNVSSDVSAKSPTNGVSVHESLAASSMPLHRP